MESWDWDSSTKAKANGLRHTFTTFSHVFCFTCAKEMLEPMQPLVSALHGEHMDIYLAFQKIDIVTNSYSDIRLKIDSWFERMYVKALHLAELIGATEERPRVCSRQRNRENHPSESVAQYWKRTVAIPFLDIQVVCSELVSWFSKQTREHFYLCAILP